MPVPVRPPTQMLAPFLPDWLWVEKSFSLQSPFVQQSFCPISERSSEPRGERHLESRLWPFDELLRHVFVKYLPQPPFLTTVPNLN